MPDMDKIILPAMRAAEGGFLGGPGVDHLLDGEIASAAHPQIFTFAIAWLAVTAPMLQRIDLRQMLRPTPGIGGQSRVPPQRLDANFGAGGVVGGEPGPRY